MLENTGKINKRLNWIESIKRRVCLELLFFFFDYLHCGSRAVPDSPPTHPLPPVGKLQLILFVLLIYLRTPTPGKNYSLDPLS